MTDRSVDELFSCVHDLGGSSIKYAVSRLVLDPERFLDDAKEEMSAKGMGVVYTKTSDGHLLRKGPSSKERKDLINRFYVPYHSGGLRRRVELAQSLLHRPELLLLDEPSTGLDPGARIDLWNYLRRLRDQFHVTVALTTHLLDEADKSDRLAILDEGRLVALDAPDELRASVGGETILLQTAEPEQLAAEIQQRFALTPRRVDDTIHLETTDGPRWLATLLAAFGRRIVSITLGRPTLEDVFMAKTGHRFRGDNPTP